MLIFIAVKQYFYKGCKTENASIFYYVSCKSILLNETYSLLMQSLIKNIIIIILSLNNNYEYKTILLLSLLRCS